MSDCDCDCDCDYEYQACCSGCDKQFFDWEMIACGWCSRETCWSCLEGVKCKCGEVFEDDMLVRINTPEALEKIRCVPLKKRLLALHAIQSAEFSIQKIVCGPVLGTRQKLYDMYMNGFLRSVGAAELKQQLEERDHALFDELCGLYQKIKDARAELNETS